MYAIKGVNVVGYFYLLALEGAADFTAASNFRVFLAHFWCVSEAPKMH